MAISEPNEFDASLLILAEKLGDLYPGQRKPDYYINKLLKFIRDEWKPVKLQLEQLIYDEAWQGRRFKTPKYNKYIKDMMLLLPSIKAIFDGKLELEITFGLSSVAADIDNPLKCFIDCLQKKYGFDDKMIYRLIVNKDIVKRGKEYIDFNIIKLNGE